MRVDHPERPRRRHTGWSAALLCLAAGALVAACGNSESADSLSGADPASTIAEAPETTTVDAEEDSVGEPASDVSASTVTTVATTTTESTFVGEAVFSVDVLPVLERTCVACHAEGQAGSSHMVLNTAADAVVNAPSIKLFTHARAMPPWPASDLSVPFIDDMSLSDREIQAIVNWVDGGALLDVEPATPIVSTQPPSYLRDPEIVMTSAKGAYTGSTAIADDYRCLVFDPQNTTAEWILGSHFVPDQAEVVHHGIMTLASSDLRDQADVLDERDPGPGWTCFGGTGLRATDGGSLVRMGGWAPGAQPSRQPEGYAIPLEPGDFFVVQIHYHYDDSAPPDLSQYVLDLASDEEIEASGGEFKPLTSELYLGPAEIPCYEGDTDPLCDRDNALERVADLYGDFVARLPDYFLWNCGSTAADYAEMTDGDAWSTCDLPVQNPGRIVSLTGHMHELGQSIRLTLNPGTPQEQILLDIPDWDFEWQLGYRPLDDIILQPGDTIRVDCAWNRERAPYEAVGYVLWADGTGDEMCYSSITTAPLD